MDNFHMANGSPITFTQMEYYTYNFIEFNALYRTRLTVACLIDRRHLLFTFTNNNYSVYLYLILYIYVHLA